MAKQVAVIRSRTSNFAGEYKIEEDFLTKLQTIVDNGGEVISIVDDGVRSKKAYVVLGNDTE